MEFIGKLEDKFKNLTGENKVLLVIGIMAPLLFLEMHQSRIQGEARVRKEEIYIQNTIKTANINPRDIVDYQSVFDMDDDGVRDYAVRMKDGSKLIVSGYNPER